MVNLIRANFARLRRSVIYKLCILFVLGMILYLMLCGRVTSSYNGETFPLERHCYNVGPFFSVVIPVFTGLFLGAEYSDGTIRNKLVVGCTRAQVFISQFLCVSAANLGLVAVWYIGILAGIPRFGFWQSGVRGMLGCLLISALFAISLSALFTLFGMLVSGKAAGSVSAIAVGLALLLISSTVYNSLCAPKEVAYAEIIDGEHIETVTEDNPYYVDEPQRSVLKFALNSLPTGQAILLANSLYDDEENIADRNVMIGSSCAETVLLLGIGILAFKKKNIK